MQIGTKCKLTSFCASNNGPKLNNRNATALVLRQNKFWSIGSRAYIPPKWAPLETPKMVSSTSTKNENESEATEGTKILRLNQMATEWSSTKTLTTEATSSTTFQTDKTASTSTSSASAAATSFSSNFTIPGMERIKTPPVIFTPKKFVPKSSDEQICQSGFTSGGGRGLEESVDAGSKIKPKWSPSGIQGRRML